jgi:hypothetical protein
MSLPSTQVQQLTPEEFFSNDFLENALVILHFHPPFSIAKKAQYSIWETMNFLNQHV